MTQGRPLTPDEILQGLDDIPWAELDQAFGKAGDDPRLLRAIVADGEDAREALWELSSALVHQGTVWPATRHAVPFLARIAAAGIGDIDHVVGTLGFIADSAIDECFEPPEDARLARAAVTAQADLLLPLLQHPDPIGRAFTAWTLAKCQAPEKILPALLAQWDAEQDFVVRATLLKAMEALDRAQAAAAASQVGSGSPAGEQLIAAEVSVTGGLPWTPYLHNASTAWITAGIDLPDWWWIGEDVPFGTLLLGLAMRGDLPVAAGLAIEALRLATTPEAIDQAAWAAGRLARAYRVPVAELAAALADLAARPGTGSSPRHLLAELAPVPQAAAQAPAPPTEPSTADLATLRDGLRQAVPEEPWMNRKRVREVAAAAKEAGTLGPAARALIPDLLPLLDTRSCRIPAVRALLSIGPAGLRRSRPWGYRRPPGDRGRRRATLGPRA